MDLELLTRDSFAPAVGEDFALADGATPLVLRLAAIGPAGAGLPGKRTPFSLVFHGPHAPRLRQGITPLAHATLGRLELFLVPIGPQPGGAMGYEAIFS